MRILCCSADTVGCVVHRKTLTCSYHGIVVSRPALMPILDLDILLRRYPAQVGPHMHPFSYILLFSGIWLLFRVPTCLKQATLIHSHFSCVAQNIINNKQLNHNKITTSLSRQMRNKVHVLQVANICRSWELLHNKFALF